MKKINVYFEKKNGNIKYSFCLFNLLKGFEFYCEYLDFYINDFLFEKDSKIKYNFLKIINLIAKIAKKTNLNNKDKLLSHLSSFINDEVQFELNVDDDSLFNYDFVEFLRDCKYKIIINSNNSSRLYDKLIKYNLINDNIFINYQNNSNNSTSFDFICMMSKLKSIVEFINNLNLTKFEQILLVYDIVKSKEYNSEKRNENYELSRDLHNVINGKNIVCVGFTNYFNFLLNELGITTNVVNISYKNKKVGHERSLVGVDDNIYNIKSIFMCDPTWDSKKDNNFINNYNYFMKNKDFFCAINSNEIINKPIFKYIYKKEDVLLNLLDVELEKTKIIMEIEKIFKCLDKKKYFDFFKHIHSPKNKIINEINECKTLLNNNVKMNVFIKSLYKVRRVEYINGLCDELPTVENICDITYKRYKSLIYFESLLEAKLITNENILGIIKETVISSILKIDFIKEIDLDLERIKLMRTLKKQSNEEIIIKKIIKNN